MPTRTFTPDQLDEIGVPNELDEEGCATELHTRQIASRRWTSVHELIFRAPDDGKAYRVRYERPLTEHQECDTWPGDEIKAVEVEERAEVVTTWRAIGSPRPDDALTRLADLMALQQHWRDGRLVSESLIPQRQIRAALGWPEPQTATDIELSAYDLAELVAFDVKAQNEDFHYAYEEYGPRFESPVLTALASDCGQFEAFHEARQDEISVWWEQEGADVLYDQHIDEARRRRHPQQ